MHCEREGSDQDEHFAEAKRKIKLFVDRQQGQTEQR